MIGLADLVLDYARRLYHDCAYHERVDGGGFCSGISRRRSFDGGAQVRVGDGGVADDAVGEFVVDKRLGVVVQVGQEHLGRCRASTDTARGCRGGT